MVKTGLSYLMNADVVVRTSSVDDPVKAQLSDPMNWNTSVYDKIFWEDIRHACARALDIGREALP